MTHRLADLPDDILYLILCQLESARDLRSLALACRRLHHLITNDGWRIFVRNRFPSLDPPLPATGAHTWSQLAESMTWQSRSWDKRSLQFQALLPQAEPRRNGRPQPGNRSLFMSVVDAHFDPATQQELVVWGAGEDIVARYRERQGRAKASKTSWHKLDGKEHGLSVGYDDVKTIKVVEHRSGRAIITGRHNGQLSLLSAEPDRFGERIAQFGPVPDPSAHSRQPLEQDTINSLDILSNGTTRVLAATKSSLRVYTLPEDEAAEVAPVATYNLTEDALMPDSAGRLGGARWMEQGESVALAYVGGKTPLRYLALSPTGFSLHAAAKSERVEKEFGIKYDRTICPNSLEPVYLHSGARRGTSLLLSSWRDGTVRLQDLRTPSPFDAVFQDNVDPWANAEALLSYGTERFLAGGGDGLTLQIFDFRWPKSYYHTAGLPCLTSAPFPRPHQPFLKPLLLDNTGGGAAVARCDPVTARACPWHPLSRALYYRPNAKYFLSESLRSFRAASVWSLARAGDVAPNLYVGVSGGVIEASLEQTPDGYYPSPSGGVEVVDPNFGFADWRAAAPSASGYKARPLVPALMETGDGYSFRGNDRSILLPSLLRYQGPREKLGAGLARHHRLDGGYQEEMDFRGGLLGGWK
ncbi:hypothetical protein C8A05DRAFT_46559 [Staphylotrichum tortipilum]|uniref:F-box domain-containing protein n=1 Tax=Staphylotrichum tortipilum TaxID=2831512 RepID=A0AAN6MEH6_9PEZI|nr:hypothetical protein C8A05DRAFT_46559 [Staphylotrichum longicolle]